LPARDTGIAAQTDESDDQAIGRSPLEDAYRRLCGVAERSSKRNAGKHVSRTSKEPIRSAAARRAVLLRSKGNCENPNCHAVKTRGRDRERIRQRLFEIARQRHQDLI
jgi:5-methylcytosine-specific restriction protein A